MRGFILVISLLPVNERIFLYGQIVLVYTWKLYPELMKRLFFQFHQNFYIEEPNWGLQHPLSEIKYTCYPHTPCYHRNFQSKICIHGHGSAIHEEINKEPMRGLQWKKSEYIHLDSRIILSIIENNSWRWYYNTDLY